MPRALPSLVSLLLALLLLACSGGSASPAGGTRTGAAPSAPAASPSLPDAEDPGASSDDEDDESEPPVDETDAGAATDPAGVPAATEEADLEASMLTADDIGEGAETSGVTLGDEELPARDAFAASDGLRAASQTLQGADGGSITDLRWQFPSADAAAMFFEEAEPALGADAGAGEPAENVQPVGDTGTVYLAESGGSRSYTFVFTVGNFAAMVRAEGPGMSDDRAQIIGQAAAQRMQAAVDGGLPHE